DELGEIFGEPTRSDWPVQEIAQRSAKLPGVAGALIATPDGLLVAGSWPGEVKNDTVAAFLPQLHNRVTQFSSHLHLGEANHFLITLGEVPLGVFKTDNSYFIVLGRAGEPLPSPQLTAVAR